MSLFGSNDKPERPEVNTGGIRLREFGKGALEGALIAGLLVGGIALAALAFAPVMTLLTGWFAGGTLGTVALGVIGGGALLNGFRKLLGSDSKIKEEESYLNRTQAMQRNAVNRQLEQEREQMASLGIGGGFSPGNIPQRQGGLSRDNM